MTPSPRPPADDPKRPRVIRRYHPHAPGFVYVALTILISLGAFNSQNNLLFAAMGLAIGALVVSGFLSGSALMSLRVERLPAGAATAGEPLSLRYLVANRGRIFPVLSLHLHELPDDRAAPRPGGFIPVVPTIRTIQAEATTIPPKRGRLRFAGVRAWSTAPYGLVRKSVSVMDPIEVLVRPPLLEPRAEVLAWFASREIEVPDHASLGHGEEFYGIREYRSGDPLRAVAWRPSARAERILVRQHARPRSTRVWVELDADHAPDDVARERAAALAASLILAAARAGAAYGFSCRSAGVGLPMRVGATRVGEVLDAIARLELGTTTAAPRVVPSRDAPRPPRDAGVIVVHASDQPPAAADRSARFVAARELERYTRVERLHPLAAQALGIGAHA